MASDGLFNPQPLIARVKMLINLQLKDVLRREKLPVSGAKAALQERVIDQIQLYVSRGDHESYGRLRALINEPKGPPTPSPVQPRTPQSGVPLPPIEPTYTLPNGHPRPPTFPTAMPPRPYTTALQPRFKDSPFYTILEPLTPVVECKVRENTRDQENVKIVFRKDLADRILSDPSLKAMVYCAADPITPYTLADIAFPYQVEIKVNEDEVKANLRGLKNKPGSTRPADITKLLRIRADYSNMMRITYALTQKKFYFIVNLVRQHPVEELVARLKAGRVITKEQVTREMVSKAQDTDIQATSSIMSLKCPISTLRIEVPCRSTICTHNQCYDAPSFLQLQEQAPTWTCPVCYKVVGFEALTIDQYVDDILKATPRSVDQVTIEPNGVWRQTSEDDTRSQPKGGRASSDDDDEDLVEISDMPRVASVKNETPGPMMRTPPDSTRSGSTSARPSLTGQKRRAEVIDLSSDEDDDPPRAPKRQSVANSRPQMNGLTNFPSEPPRRPSYPSSTSFQLPRLMQPNSRATMNPMAPGYRTPQ
ncbi:MAG: SUMO ligase siz1 [Heterodermia speciosa]|uniref:SUMO ligase siz1 n=1 Tax=Heterodermia speciosa TaxID=116794 RepID=A0A8H3ER41_9LECA|nr:MAG: SUMO ligase siz1 [Heterodermia speciosa]